MSGKKITKCPLCGCEIFISALFQVSHDYKLTKSGRMSRKYTVNLAGSEEVLIASCGECDADWAVGDFSIDDDGYFIDYKYDE